MEKVGEFKEVGARGASLTPMGGRGTAPGRLPTSRYPVTPAPHRSSGERRAVGRLTLELPPRGARPAGGWCGAGVTGGLEVGSGPEARPRPPIGLGEAPRAPTSLKSQLFPTKKLHQKQEGFQRKVATLTRREGRGPKGQ